MDSVLQILSAFITQVREGSLLKKPNINCICFFRILYRLATLDPSGFLSFTFFLCPMIVRLAPKRGNGSKGGADFVGAALIHVRDLGLTGRHCPTFFVLESPLHDQDLSGKSQWLLISA